MSEQIRISAKNLGALALDEFCPRCSWIKLRLRDKIPYQIFPGIFSSIDSYNKRVVHSWIEKHGGRPPWLDGLGEVVAYREPPHFSKFNIVDDEYNILLTGSPDGVFVRGDKSHLIVDYKTAKFTGAQDKLLPMYDAQLNAYALIGEQRGLAPVSGLALIYMEPKTGDEVASRDENHREDGFIMGFSANIFTVTLAPTKLRPLLAKTREIYELTSPPVGRAGCKDCPLVDQLVGLVK